MPDPATMQAGSDAPATQPGSYPPTTDRSVSTAALAGPGIVWRGTGMAGNAVIQIGAFSTPARAMHAIEIARRSSPALSQAHNQVEKVTPTGRAPVWRTRFAGLPSGQTDTICTALRQQGLSCLAITP